MVEEKDTLVDMVTMVVDTRAVTASVFQLRTNMNTASTTLTTEVTLDTLSQEMATT
ncbi:UNVERIFIED_CONTAM: hypothetical protein GTU68_007171 [Idotea baltica]|nr:hypothetical protein [Idotea baltica]